jgi:thiol:disulfide interchange protein DsbA
MKRLPTHRCLTLLFTALLFFAGLTPGFTAAQTTAQTALRPGIDFEPINPPQPVSTGPGQVELIEFFSYMCPHCAQLDPVLERWRKTLPRDVVFSRSPVTFRRWVVPARLYFTLSALGELDRLHAAVFTAIANRSDLMSERGAIDWAVKNGIPEPRFIEAYRSFSVTNNARRAETAEKSYGIEGVPSFVIGGKYRVPGAQYDGQTDLFVLLRTFIDKVRSEQAAAQTPAGKPRKR